MGSFRGSNHDNGIIASRRLPGTQRWCRRNPRSEQPDIYIGMRPLSPGCRIPGWLPLARNWILSLNPSGSAEVQNLRILVTGRASAADGRCYRDLRGQAPTTAPPLPRRRYWHIPHTTSPSHADQGGRQDQPRLKMRLPAGFIVKQSSSTAAPRPAM